MMSATVVSPGAASSGYYKTEGYYTAGSEEGDAAASWFGKGAEALGLEGRVDDEMFTQMLDGQTFVPSRMDRSKTGLWASMWVGNANTVPAWI